MLRIFQEVRILKALFKRLVKTNNNHSKHDVFTLFTTKDPKQNITNFYLPILLTVDSAFLEGVKKMFRIGEENKELVDPYFVFSFAGKEVRIF